MHIINISTDRCPQTFHSKLSQTSNTVRYSDKSYVSYISLEFFTIIGLNQFRKQTNHMISDKNLIHFLFIAARRRAETPSSIWRSGTESFATRLVDQL
jgi:hypothetical protein